MCDSLLRWLKDAGWLSRDPVEEKGGQNLYACLGNDLINFVDLLGLEDAVLVGSNYVAKGFAGHASMDIYGIGYGFGPKGAFFYWTTGETSGWETTNKPRDEHPLYIRYSGKFLDDKKTSCGCANRERILQCANWYKKTWDGTLYTFPVRTCRTYVAAIIAGCCLKN